MSVRVHIVDYDEGWPSRFDELASTLRSGLGELIDRIDHIGSTAIPGLAAKPIVDVQMTVADWDRFDSLRIGMERFGYRFHADNDDRRKRYFTLTDQGERAANVHVRLTAEFSAQSALLLRDYLRIDETARSRYEAEKRRLATSKWEKIDDYAEAKGDVIWQLLREADDWAKAEGWIPGPADA